MKANNTLVTPITAAAAMVMLSQCKPINSNASDTEASPPRLVYGVMPVITSDTATYSTMAMASDNSTARGRSRCGCLASSAAVVSVS